MRKISLCSIRQKSNRQIRLARLSECCDNGQNIKQISLDTLRGRIGLISQESMLFHDSIRENIGYGSAAPSDAKIKEAAVISGIYEHVATLQDGFNSLVGDKGTKLSGGQKQRIAIARAILKDADVIDQA